MNKLTTTIICLLAIFFSVEAQVKLNQNIITIKKQNYSLQIKKDKFAFSLHNHKGELIADFHEQSGVSIGITGDTIMPATKYEQTLVANDTLFSCLVSNAKGIQVKLNFRLLPEMINLRIIVPNKNLTAKQPLTYSIEARTAGFGPAYGLGDHGSYGQSTNVFGYQNNQFMNINDGSRFVSSFAFFPKQQFAQVVFEKASKRVGINAKETKLGANLVNHVNIYYFFGKAETIYSNYAKIRNAEGYKDFKPKYEFFDVGYEAFGSLGWNTAQNTVQKDVSTYLEKGYPLKWIVVGSGFWKGDRQSATEGSTNAWGIWDDTYQEGRQDKLANPRYPDVAEFKKYFKERDLKLILGIRVNYKAIKEQGGYNFPVNDGPFTAEGLKNDYFIKDNNGQPKLFSVIFPKGCVYMLDANNQEAVNWFYEGSKKWDAQGYKEDTMMIDGREVMNDAKVNKANEILMRNGNYVMVRNSAYSVPGDIIRIEDTQHGQVQDRPIINVLNYAASGATNTYPDIVGGKYHTLPLKEDVKRYFVRNALFAAVCPAMSFGLGPWHLENINYEKALKKAADWHHEFTPYIYSAALESHYTGFPGTMTPLPIAFPSDSATYNLANRTIRQYSWMLGPSLLATPAYGNDYATAVSRNVYLPKGEWIDYENGATFTGPQLLKDYPFPDDKIPVFIGGKGILVKKSASKESFTATVYPVNNSNSSYTFHYPDGNSKSVISNKGVNWKGKGIRVTEIGSNKEVVLNYSKLHQSYSFEIKQGRNYLIQNKK